ncbi:hypothetical protein P9209_23380 [Prescottella defluvii]|nr:hypothetical protein P9209_23380 [Prescottella defluvii]
MSHEAIKSAVDAMNGEALRASAEGWKKIGQSLEQSLNDFRDFMANTIKDGTWEGIAADSARAATANYAEDSTKLAAAGKLVGSKIEEAATAIDQVKSTVPPVAKRSIAEAVVDVLLPPAGLFKSLTHEQDEAHQAAIQIMRTVYTPVMQQSDTKVPTLQPPAQVIDEKTQTHPGHPRHLLGWRTHRIHALQSTEPRLTVAARGRAEWRPAPGTTPGADIPDPTLSDPTPPDRIPSPPATVARTPAPRTPLTRRPTRPPHGRHRPPRTAATPPASGRPASARSGREPVAATPAPTARAVATAAGTLHRIRCGRRRLARRIPERRARRQRRRPRCRRCRGGDDRGRRGTQRCRGGGRPTRCTRR